MARKRLVPTDQGGSKIINVADPTSAQDAATKAYVDANIGGGGGGGGGVGVPTTIVVAASNSSAADKALATGTYTCDGTADNVQIQAAIDAVHTAGGQVILAAGTYNIASVINMIGENELDDVHSVTLRGVGVNATSLVCASNVSGIHIYHNAKVNISDLAISVTGTGNGIESIADEATYMRGFWQSSFKNIRVTGPWSSAHTGWGMKLGCPFRSTFENIEIEGCRNGIQLYTMYADFNPGDCTFIRCFVEIAGGSGVAYHLRGDVNADCTMNQVHFIMCEAICDGSASTTGILIDGNGSGYGSWNTFTGINLEQFAILIDVEKGEGNSFDCNYIEPKSAGTVFKCASGAGNNRFSARTVYSNSATPIINDANTTGMPNFFERIKLFADSSANATISKVATTVIRDNIVQSGGGTVSSEFTKAAQRIAVGTSAPASPSTGDLWVDTN